MRKYNCIQCGLPAEHVDFLNNSKDQVTSAVYVYCTNCKIDAWGGIRFHPEMNELLNQRFTPNFEYTKQESDRTYTLIP